MLSWNMHAAAGMRRLLILAGIGAVAGAGLLAIEARADEASDALAAAGDEAKAYANCTTDYSKPLLRSSETAEQIADDTANACDAKLGAIKIALEGAPAYLTDAKADQVVSDILAASRANLIKLINQARN